MAPVYPSLEDPDPSSLLEDTLQGPESTGGPGLAAGDQLGDWTPDWDMAWLALPGLVSKAHLPG